MDGGVVCSGRVLLERELRAGEGGRREGERGWSGRVGLERVGKGGRSWRVKVGLERLVGAEEEGWSWTGVVWPAPGGRSGCAVQCTAVLNTTVQCDAEHYGAGSSRRRQEAAGAPVWQARQEVGPGPAGEAWGHAEHYTAIQCSTMRRSAGLCGG